MIRYKIKRMMASTENRRLQRRMRYARQRTAETLSAMTAVEEYSQMAIERRRVLTLNFTAGLARGLGMAIGFTILGGLAIYALQFLARYNTGFFSAFIDEIVEKLQASLR